MKSIRIPRTLYTLLPAICILVATVGLALPPTVSKWFCVSFLYVYAAVILFLRLTSGIEQGGI